MSTVKIRRKSVGMSKVFLVTLLLTVMFFSSIPAAQAQDGAPPLEPIVGGTVADLGEYPWQVALISGDAPDPTAQFCGGSLIHEQWVLTAAHCVVQGGVTVSAASLDVVAGINNLSTGVGFQRRDVIQVIPHPSYNVLPSDSDVALLQLASPITLGGSGEGKTAIIPLVPSNIGALVGVNSVVTGWGTTSSGGFSSLDLLEVDVPIYDNSVCNDASHYNGGITDNMLCAGFEAGGKDSCQGDSGGPLVVFSEGQYKLAGVVSFGDGCALPLKPGVYARVSQFISWINTYVPSEATTFTDVGTGYWAYSFIERLFSSGITSGCAAGLYCPESSVTRAQMAIFLEKGIHGSSFTPLDVIPTFTDTAGHFAEDWIEALKNDGVTSGCGSGIYCPESPVTRAQMAIFLLKAKYGAAYIPPAVGGSTGFTDVPVGTFADAWIKQLAAEGITGGCGGGNYCPDNSVTRAQMAVFLVNAFNLP